MTRDCQESRGGYRPGAIIGGAFLLVIGGTMFLERSGLTDISPWRMMGPACLMIIGMVTLAESRSKDRDKRRDGISGGLWLLGLGCWMAVSQLHLFGLDYHSSWPLLIILSGTIMLVRGTR